MSCAALDIDAVNQRLQRAFQPAAAAEADHVYQYRVGDEDLFHLAVRRGELQVGAGAHPRPSVTFIVDELDTALGILEGSVDPMAAFMDGRVRTDGHLILALQLGLMFRRPD